LIELDQHGAGRVLRYAAPSEGRVCDEDVVADNLGATALSGCLTCKTLPIILVNAAFDQDDREGFEPLLIESDQLIARIPPFARLGEIVAIASPK
jgi:hypothetical protein